MNFINTNAWRKQCSHYLCWLLRCSKVKLFSCFWSLDSTKFLVLPRALRHFRLAPGSVRRRSVSSALLQTHTSSSHSHSFPSEVWKWSKNQQKPSPSQGSRWDQAACGFLQTSQRWCWNASWTRMVFVHAHSLETTAGISCMNSADLSLVCLFCFLPSVSPVKGNYLRCSRPFCSKSRIICSPAERCFLWIFSEIANQK